MFTFLNRKFVFIKKLYILFFIICNLVVAQQSLSISSNSFIRSATYTGEVAVFISQGILSRTYYVPPACRLTDLVLSDSFNINLLPRTILVLDPSKENKETLYVDLFKIMLKQDQDKNIKVFPGMHVVIPYPSKFAFVVGEFYNVYGRTKIEKIPLKDRETIKDLVSILPLTPDADSSKVFLIRDGISSSVDSASFGEIFVNHNDYILIPRNKSSRCYLVYVDGEVERPGYYPIVHDSTRIRDILSDIKPLKTADLNRFIIRRNSSLYRDQKKIELQSPRTEVQCALNNLGSTLYTYIGKDTTVLLAGDVIEVQKRVNVVYVKGFVKNQGALLYDSTYSVQDYIRLAGGFSKSADKLNVRVLTVVGSSVHIKDVKKLEPGDVIIVPEISESKWVKTYLPLINVISSMMSIVVALISVSK